MPELSTPPRAIFNQIRANLADRYRSGFPVLLELVQNAEDAGARLFRAACLRGWPEAANPLLQVPGLLVVNDGPFREKDGPGILSFADSAKGDETASIGRFGFGQKALFHLCDAFVAHAFGQAASFSEVVNPCLRLIEGSRAASWDAIGAADLRRLERAAGLRSGFLLWVALRCEPILPAPRLSFTEARPSLAEVLDEAIGCEPQLRLLLAGLRRLDRLEIRDERGPRLVLARAAGSGRMAGPDAEGRCTTRAFKGSMEVHRGENRSPTARYVGREADDATGRLADLVDAEDWPRSPVFTADGQELRKEKAVAHGAVVLVETGALGSVRLDWAVFLPVAPAATLDAAGLPGLRILLHGYFFTDPGRRTIEGVEEAHGASAPIRHRWNTRLRDALVLPLLPAVLHDALEAGIVSPTELAVLVAALRASPFGRMHARAITSSCGLVRAVEPTTTSMRARWRLVGPTARLRPLPAPDERDRVPAAGLFPDLARFAHERGLTLVSGPEAALAPKPPAWETEELARLLGSLAPEVFLEPAKARELASFLAVAVGADGALRRAAADPLLAALRAALGASANLAPEGTLRAILEVLPEEVVVGLPAPAGERPVLRALASAADAPLCVRAEWVGEEARRRSLEVEEAAALLRTLAPLLRQETGSDPAAAAGLRILGLLGPQLAAAARQPDLASLPVLRAMDGTGRSRLLTFAELLDASRRGRLFRDEPKVQEILGALARAVPDAGAVALRGEAARMVAEIGQPFALARPDPTAWARVVEGASRFGPPDARAKLLQLIRTEEGSARPGLRALAAGDPAAASDRIELVALPAGREPLDRLLTALLEGDAARRLVPAEIVHRLDRAHTTALGIRTLDGPALGKLLRDRGDRLEPQLLDAATLAALYESDLPDADLRELPLFPAQDGSRRTVATIWRLAEWPVPRELADRVPLLAPLSTPKARERAEHLVRPWSPSDQLRLALEQPEPHRLARVILDAVAKVADQKAEPLREALRSTEWLRDRLGRAWRPEDVLDLPEPVLTAARRAWPEGELPFLPLAELDPAIREAEGFERLRALRILPDQDGSIEALLLVANERPPLAWMGERAPSQSEALRQLAEAGEALPLAGWPLLAELLRLRPDRAIEFPGAFGRVSETHIEEAVVWLDALATLAQHGNTAARRAYDAAFRDLCRWPRASRAQVLARARVPVRRGAWRPGREVAARVEGLAPEHLLDEQLERSWPDEPIEPHPSEASPGDTTGRPGSLPEEEQACARSLGEVLKRAADDVPPEALAVVIGFVRRTEPFKRLARKIGSSDERIETWWERLRIEVDDRFRSDRPGREPFGGRHRSLLRFKLTRATEIEVETLSGARVPLPAGTAEPLALLGDGHRRARVVLLGGQDVRRREVTIAAPNGSVEDRHLRAFAQRLAIECFDYAGQNACLEALDHLLEEALRPEQATVEDAQARLRDRLPQLLAELKPAPGSTLAAARDRFERAEQRLRPGAERDRQLPALKTELWQDLLQPGAEGELLRAIRGRIGDYGYDPSRVLFELLQNADDACLQHPPPGEPRFRLELGPDRIRALHWGRLINHPGADPGEGERQGWQRDLFNMLVMNLSEKREEVTGRFGLGFKCVHLIARTVAVASGFVACRIRGGMLPEPWEQGRRVSSEHAAEGRRATVVDLELDPACERAARDAQRAFVGRARWLPAMTRAIRRIEIIGEHPETWAARFAPTGIEGIELLTLDGPRPGHALALRLDERSTLLLLLGAEGPVPAEPEAPRLWLLAPLEETLCSGWLLNSFEFRVDPGRGRLAGSEAARRELFQKLGEGLRTRLLSLFDALEANWPGFAARVELVERDPRKGLQRFLAGLVKLFARDLEDPLAKHLHGPTRGLGRLIGERPALPTGLPAPFAPLLRAGDVRFELVGALADVELLKDLVGWRVLGEIGGCSVGPEAARLLGELGFGRPRRLGLAEVVRWEIGDDRRVDPALAARLGRILSQDRLARPEWSSERNELFGVAGNASFRMADGSWAEARLPPRASPDGDAEERLVLAFAPDRAVADPGYTGDALRLYRLARQRSGFQQTARVFAEWAASEGDPERRRALLRYLLDGRQGGELAEELQRRRPGWLPPDPQALRSSPLVQGLGEQEVAKLLSLLFPAENARLWIQGIPIRPVPPPSPGLANPAHFLERLHAWWRHEHGRERTAYDREAYPSGFRPHRLVGQDAAADREGWFTFFALAVFRTIGRTHEAQHRSFVERAQQVGWWRQMACAPLPDDPGPWIRRLEDLARAEAWRIDFPQWRRALADLYVLARWLPDYVDAFLALPRLVAKEGRILLAEVWRPSSSRLWQRRGLEGAPLTQSLGLGANWLVREAVRHGIWKGEDAVRMHPYGWAATGRLRKLVGRIGLGLEQAGSMDHAPDIFAFVEKHLGERAAFLGDLDLPLQLVTDDGRAALRARLLGPAAAIEPLALDEGEEEDDEEDLTA